MATDSFQIGETTFELSSLDPMLSTELLGSVFTVLPDLAKIQEQIKGEQKNEREAAKALVAMARLLPQLVRLIPPFRAACTARDSVAKVPVSLRNDGDSGDVIFARTFGRKQDALIEWILQCVALEYGTFLEKASRNTDKEAASA